MRLNEFGETFLTHALAIEKEMRDAKSKIAALKSGDTGHVILGTAAWSTQILPEILVNITKRRPELRFRVVESNAAHLEHMLLEGRIDLSISAYAQPLDEQIVVEETGEVEIGLVAAADHPLTRLPQVRIGDLARCRWILAEGDNRTATYLERQFARAGLAWNGPDIEILPRHALLEIVANTELVSFLPLLTLPGSGASVTSLRCPDLNWRVPAGMSFRKNRPVTAAGRIVVEDFKRYFHNALAAPRRGPRTE